MSKSKTMWITRDDDGGSYTAEIVAWPYKAYPQKDKEGDWCSDSECIDQFDDVFFANWTGITLKPGEKRKYRLVKV